MTEELHKSLVNHYSQNVPSREEADRLKEYTGSMAAIINNHLWNKHLGEEDKEPDSPHYNRYANKLNSSLKKHKAPHDFTTYSSTSMDPRNVADKNNIVHHPAFLSTSLDPEVAHNRDINQNYRTGIHHILKISVPKGSSGFYLPTPDNGKYRPDNKAHTNFPEEKEFLIPHSSNLKYSHTTEEKKIHPVSRRMQHIMHHHMELLPK